MEDKTSLTNHFLRSDVAAGLPFLWTVGAGLFAGLAAAMLGWTVGFDAAKSAAAAAAVTVLICYPSSWLWWVNKLEAINRGPQLSRPTRIEIYLDGGKRVLPSTIPATPQEIYAIAKKAIAGVPLSGRAMASVMPRDRFYLFQAALVEAKLAAPRSDNNKEGVRLTELGRRTFERIAAGPLPQAEVEGEWDVFTLIHTAHTGRDDGR